MVRNNSSVCFFPPYPKFSIHLWSISSWTAWAVDTPRHFRHIKCWNITLEYCLVLCCSVLLQSTHMPKFAKTQDIFIKVFFCLSVCFLLLDCRADFLKLSFCLPNLCISSAWIGAAPLPWYVIFNMNPFVMCHYRLLWSAASLCTSQEVGRTLGRSCTVCDATK